MSLPYECHITVELTPEVTRPTLEELGKTLKWKTSCIDKDPVLGDRVFFYFTKHARTYDELFISMEEACKHIPNVIRKKIEHIVYDTRSQTIPTTI